MNIDRVDDHIFDIIMKRCPKLSRFNNNVINDHECIETIFNKSRKYIPRYAK